MNELILKDVRRAFGVRVHEILPVSGGYLNKKWRVSTDQGEILVKQYSHERFDRRKLRETERALARQMILYAQGIPCPHIWKAGETIIRQPSEEIDYMVMDWIPGQSVGPDSVTLTQMESLGEACARMHAAFACLPVEGVKAYPLDERSLIGALHETYRRGTEECPTDAPEAYRVAMAELSAARQRVDFSFLPQIEKSIAHEDFTPDNMLFLDSGVAAILDFDRNQYSFPLHDVGRILLSLALTGGRMDRERVRAFQRGYSRHKALSTEQIAEALRLVWLIEIPWWMQPGYFAGTSPKVSRFVEEMRYLSKNLSDFADGSFI